MGGIKASLQSFGIFSVCIPSGGDIRIRSPARPVDLHKRNARFDQRSCEQDALTKAILPVTLAGSSRFVFDRKGLLRIAGSQQIDGFVLPACPSAAAGRLAC